MTTNSHTYTATIKQHTPLLHFHRPEYIGGNQNDSLPEVQNGATLRASELKPKFDKFLIDKKNSGRIPLRSEWNIIGKNDSLDYKVRIIPDGKLTGEIIDKRNTPMFFANMGNTTHKVLSQTDNPITVTFFSLHQGLLKLIEENFDTFLFQTNFGTRQSKGYGSFTSVNISNKGYLGMHLLLEQKVNHGQKPSYTDVMEVINYYYQRLKSGINIGQKCIYFDSFLKTYIINNENINYVWEKKWLKESIIPELKKSDSNSNDGKFVRAFLGLNESFTFMSKFNAEKNRCNKVPLNKRSYPASKNEIKVKHRGKQISRFQSPITFKPIFDGINWRIYLHLNEINPKLLGQDFDFEIPEKETKKLSTPDSPIDLKDLIQKYHKELGNRFEAFAYRGSIGWVKIINP